MSTFSGMRTRCVKRGQSLSKGLAVVFFLATPVFADERAEADLTGYLLRIGLALGLLALCGYLLVRFAPRTILRKTAGMEILAILPLGRDVVRVFACGPEVIAVLSSKSGSVVVGRWSREEWRNSCVGKDQLRP
jgi:hypothetical protein